MRFFFVVALGRSGTEMLSTLLKNDPRAWVHHEPYDYDAKLVGLRRAGVFDSAVDSLLSSRFDDLLSRVSERHEVYGEVNSYLRYEIEWLRERFSPAIVRIHRDGRDFVRSSYSRAVFTGEEGQLPILPLNGDIYAERWASLSRFEKLCWYWNHTNMHLAERVTIGAKMERAFREFGYFRERILEPLGLDVAEGSWASLVSRPRNTRAGYQRGRFARRLFSGSSRMDSPGSIPHWSNWDSDMTRRFWEICGDTMGQLGYR